MNLILLESYYQLENTLRDFNSLGWLENYHMVECVSDYKEVDCMLIIGYKHNSTYKHMLKVGLMDHPLSYIYSLEDFL